MIRARPACLAQLVLVLLCSLRAVAHAGDAPVVILLSWDGTRWDYPSRASFPGLERMAREGAHAQRLTPVFPSSTFPNHVSLATGTYVDRHGIIDNSFTDRQGKRFDYGNDATWLEAEPLWSAAERQGVRAAVFFWVGSETPWHGHGASYSRLPFDTHVQERAKVEQILAWLDLPAKERPQLVMSWWHGCDSVGHEQGPGSPEIAAQLAREDRELGRLLAGLDARNAWSHTTLLIASDHGMAEIHGAVDAEGALRSADIRARVSISGGEGQVYLADRAQLAAALAALGQVKGLSAYDNESLPAHLRSNYPGRSGDIALLAHPPWMLGHPRLGEGVRAWWSRLIGSGVGAHGFDPALPEMGAIFYALGRGVPAGAQLGEVRAIDVAPTAAALLGIAPPAQSEGKALFGAVTQTASASEARSER
ncbi:MAG TPA: ectonucleotide pyrophosphatase/phosphodiesterase [Myxococcota bacterium]|nr:ectonucleotide pyrophosphatase/phosphodiesterase [Myxococcota bacterium]